MRISPKSFFASNRRVFLLLGIVLGLGAFNVATWRINSQSNSTEERQEQKGASSVWEAL